MIVATKRDTFTSGVIIFCIILILLLLKFFYPTSSRLNISKAGQENTFDKLVEKQSLWISDTLSYREYKRKQDSIRRELSDALPHGGQSLGVANFGVEEIDTRDKKYYIDVTGYFAKDFFEFYSLHDKNFIEYSIPEKKVNNVQFGVPKTEVINSVLNQLDDSEWQIKYPISKTGYYFWLGIVVLLMLAFAGALFYGVIGIPLRLLFLIANGKAFGDESIGRLYKIARIFLFTGFFLSIARLFFHLYFKSQTPYPLTFYYYDDLMSGSWFIIIGLAILILAKAFQRGYELQQEQELTV